MRSARRSIITLEVPDWPGHVAGQHVDVRLTAEDGYSAVRSYSIASAPGSDGRVQITVERLPDGEVSPYLTRELAVGDRLDLRGPIGAGSCGALNKPNNKPNAVKMHRFHGHHALSRTRRQKRTAYP